MADFKKQIEEDIRAYQEKYGDTIHDIKKDEWAFNFWILDKFFYEDEEVYCAACNSYATQYMSQQNTDYTKMIKAAIDYDLFQASHANAVSMYEMMSSFA